jgi:nucleotide-binding universal stress UspA family protein
MSDLPTVVACVDDSECTQQLVAAAQIWARPAAGGRVYAAHAVVPPPASFEELLFPLASLGDDREAIHAELLELAARSLGRRLRDSVARDAFRMAWGDAPEALLSIAASLGPDVLVVGAGYERLRTAGVLGPVATSLLRRSLSPVLVVPPQLPVSAPRNIVLALDLAHGSAALLAHALQIASDFDGRVLPVFVAPLADYADHAGVFGQRQGDPLVRARKEIQRLYTSLLESTPLAFPVARQREQLLAPLEVLGGDPGRELVAFAESAAADVIVIARTRLDDTSGQRLGRVAEFVARNAAVPVLVCPPRAVDPG